MIIIIFLGTLFYLFSKNKFKNYTLYTITYILVLVSGYFICDKINPKYYEHSMFYTLNEYYINSNKRVIFRKDKIILSLLNKDEYLILNKNNVTIINENNISTSIFIKHEFIPNKLYNLLFCLDHYKTDVKYTLLYNDKEIVEF